MKKLAIIGLGLIGGSIALALKNNAFAGKIIAYDPDEQALKFAFESQIIDVAATDIAAAVQQANCILLAAPLKTYSTIFKTLLPHLQPDAVITDVGSTKFACIALAQQLLGDAYSRFVPGHPLAGKEKSSIHAAEAELFQNKLTFLTPTATTEQQAIGKVQELWKTMGARVELIDAAQHDEIMAATSHLPQLLTYTYLQALQNHRFFPELLQYTGTGFKDFSRLASSSPELWADIACNNQDALLQQIHAFQQQLELLREALAAKNPELLQNFFKQAKQAYEQYTIANKVAN